jgi:hypothetical protein
LTVSNAHCVRRQADSDLPSVRGLYDWPLFVGKSWPSEFQIKNYDRNQTLDLKYVLTVEAFEEVTIPAGTFKTFRIRRTSPDDRYVIWYEPKLEARLGALRDTPLWHRDAPDGNALEHYQELMLPQRCHGIAESPRDVPYADGTSNRHRGNGVMSAAGQDSITSSARNRMELGTAMPSALAARGLMTRS